MASIMTHRCRMMLKRSSHGLGFMKTRLNVPSSVGRLHQFPSVSARSIERRTKRGVAMVTPSATLHNIQANRPVAWWLLGCAGMVAGMVTVGGITRLTRSGLSMVDWKPHGGLPPLTQDEWNVEFAKYQQFPEFQQRQDMTLDEFKSIFWWEYGHRMLGRVLGGCFVLPLTYFAIRKRVPRELYGRLGGLLALGATQGGIGWWMVKSGLDQRNAQDQASRREIRVSPYRLATHLGMAFTTYSLLLWTAFDVLNPRTSAHLSLTRDMMDSVVLSHAAQIRRLGHVTAGILGITILSGAFMAGIDAGSAYNTFPKMDGHWIPERIFGLVGQPWYANFFEDTATVQFDHRLLALTTTAGISGMYALARVQPQVWNQLPPVTKSALTRTLVLVACQASLGITTLLNGVPLDLAVTHQAGSLVLLSSVLWTMHTLRFAKRSPVAIVRQASTTKPFKAI